MKKAKPIRPQEVKKLSIIRNPGVGPLLERLRMPRAVDAIGFHRNLPIAESFDEAGNMEKKNG